MTSRTFLLTRPIRSHRAFTLVEMIVAVGIFAVLLAVILIPINLAATLTGVGQARAGAQNAAEQGVRQITSDLQRAIYIFPNDNVMGVTNGINASDAYIYAANVRGNQPYPYYLTNNETWNPCDAGSIAMPNASRIDMLLPNTPFGHVDPKLQPSGVLVSYYCRRRDVTQAADPIKNPIVLFRAQMPYRYFETDSTSGATVARPLESPTVPGAYNVLLSPGRYAGKIAACSANAAKTNQELKWLTMNKFGEFNLEPLCISPTNNASSPQPVFATHTAVLPRDVVLISPFARPTPAAGQVNDVVSFVPQVTFSMSSTNANGKVNRVNISMSVGQYDSGYSVRRDSRNGPNAPRRSGPQAQISRSVIATVDAINVR